MASAIKQGAPSCASQGVQVQSLTKPDRPRRFSDAQGRNTTLSVVILNVTIDKSQLHQVAKAATAAYYPRITPCGTSFDGDIIFALCPLTGPTATLLAVEALAARAVAAAIERAVRTATGREGIPGLADPH